MRTYLQLTNIEGESFTMADGAIDVVGYDFNMGYPYDLNLGEKTGPLRYNPVWITKRVDKASPIIFQHLSTNAAIDEGKIIFYRETDKGNTKWEHYYTVTLTDVRIIEQTQFLKTQDENTSKASFLEKVGFICRTVDFTDPIATTAHSAVVRDEITG